jgi:hypothetical protein
MQLCYRARALSANVVSETQRTGIANSISGTVKVVHVLERCCEV